MQVIADLHIHSRFSRACSKQTNITNLEKYARLKGLGLLGTGDFQHPKWQPELKQELAEIQGTGICQTKTGYKFICQTEISLVYTDLGKGRRVHHVVLAPSLEVASQITEALAKKGRIDYDGRPIFNMRSDEFVEMLRSISEDIEVIPAHCLVPQTGIHTNPGVKQVQDIRIGDVVLTHKGRYRRVIDVFSRDYKGDVYKIIPWYFSSGTITTPEHPFFAIRTDKQCSWTKGLVCKPVASHKRICHTKAYEQYQPEWMPAAQLQKGDILLYPKFIEFHDQCTIHIGKASIQVTPEFCRLAGYYLAEGYTNNRDAVCFTFHHNETQYCEDVKAIMLKLFNAASKKGKTAGDLIFYSKTLLRIFQKLFYNQKPYRAQNKALPFWMLSLPLEKQREIILGWWRGDAGYTVSRTLAHQMKMLCLRMNIIPNLRIDTAAEHSMRGNHILDGRKIKANFDLYALGRLSFLEDAQHLLGEKEFRRFKSRSDIRHAWFDDQYLYIPVRSVERTGYDGKVYNLEVEDDNSYVAESAAVHNCWTPWFGVFGDKSGYDSLKDCFHDQARHIHAIETGISSDPAMNRRLSQLDSINIVSFSDMHSFWPWRIGREATIFDVKELTYNNILKAIRTGEGLAGTIEFFPEEGKYHYDGHRACRVAMSPAESDKANKICPACKRPMTIGVAHRVEKLADRKADEKLPNLKPFHRLIPLSELISAAIKSPVASKNTFKTYYELVGKFGNEFTVLLDTPEEELKKAADAKTAELIMKNRRQEIKWHPGYDGEYGHPIFEEHTEQNPPEQNTRPLQKSLGEF